MWTAWRGEQHIDVLSCGRNLVVERNGRVSLGESVHVCVVWTKGEAVACAAKRETVLTAVAMRALVSEACCESALADCIRERERLF